MSQSSEHPHRRSSVIRVLEATDPPGPTIRYIDQVVRYAPADIEYLYFSWRTVLTSNYDVFHVHWPELMLQNRQTWKRGPIRLLFLLLISRLVLSRIPVIRTIHDLTPHTPVGRLDRTMLGWFDAITTDWVVLNGCTPTPKRGRIHHIPHGDYREQFEDFPVRAAEPGRFVLVGRLQPYKNVDGLIRAFAEVAEPEQSLHIVGSPSPGYEDTLLAETTRALERGANVSCTFRYVSDEEMVEEVHRSEIVMLPYHEMHNSGVAFVALSLGRPVIVPRTCVNEELQREVGSEWVAIFDGEFTAKALRDALADLSQARNTAPSFAGRDWTTIGETHAELFRTVRARR